MAFWVGFATGSTTATLVSYCWWLEGGELLLLWAKLLAFSLGTFQFSYPAVIENTVIPNAINSAKGAIPSNPQAMAIIRWRYSFSWHSCYFTRANPRNGKLFIGGSVALFLPL